MFCCRTSLNDVITSPPAPAPAAPAPLPLSPAAASTIIESTIDWEHLYDLILAERQRRELSITEFLVLCNLDPTNYYFKILCSQNGKTCFPFDNKYFIGSIFKNSVCTYLKNTATTTAAEANPAILVGLENALADWNLDNVSFLSTHHISIIHLLSSYSSGIVIRAFAECNLTDAEILQTLMMDLHISRALMGCSLFVAQRKICNDVPAVQASSNFLEKQKPIIDELKLYQQTHPPAAAAAAADTI